MKSPISYWREKQKEYQYLDKKGKIISFTKIYHPPEGFGKGPYYTAVIEFGNRKKKTGQLVLEGKKPKIGTRVKGILRIIGQPDKTGIINYGIKFKIL
jgi:uncharacterized OB-fold protein